jgi:hypothetical protein
MNSRRKEVAMLNSLWLTVWILIAAGIPCAIVGCSFPPPSAPWNENEKVIAPEMPAAKGYLVVETAIIGNAENGRVPHAPYFVYDTQGRYLDRFPNANLVPISLRPGRYVVVSSVSGESRKVQVEIKEEMTTYITLKDFKAAQPVE